MKFSKGKQTWDPKMALKVARVLNLAADIIVGDMKDGITKHSEDIHGREFAKLSPNTIASKKKKGQSSKPLLAEGKMKEVYVRSRANNKKLVAVIGVNKRDRLGASVGHNEGSGNLPKREWFGVSKRAEKKCVKLARKMIKKELRIMGG